MAELRCEIHRLQVRRGVSLRACLLHSRVHDVLLACQGACGPPYRTLRSRSSASPANDARPCCDAQLRHGELLRNQERLVCEMERAVQKRDVIATRVRLGICLAIMNSAIAVRLVWAYMPVYCC